MNRISVTTTGNFTVFFDVSAKKITVKNAAYLKPTSFTAFNNTTKQKLIDNMVPDQFSLNGNDIIAYTNENLSGMANTDEIICTFNVAVDELTLGTISGFALRNAYAVTPNDNADIPEGIGYICVFGNGGNVNVTTAGGQDIILALDKKEIVPLLIKRVKAASTTATSIMMLK